MLGRHVNSKIRFIINLTQQIQIKRNYSLSFRCYTERATIANKYAAFNTLLRPFIYGQQFATVASADNTPLLRRESKYKEMEKNLKYREDPVIMTLDTPQFKSIFTENLIKLHDIFERHNYEIRIAGGAVR